MSTPNDTGRYSGRQIDKWWHYDPVNISIETWEAVKPKVSMTHLKKDLIILGTSGTEQNKTKCKTGKKQSEKTDDI